MDERARLMPIVNMRARCPYCNEVTRFDYHPECDDLTPVRTCGHFDGYFEEDEVWWVGFLEGGE